MKQLNNEFMSYLLRRFLLSLIIIVFLVTSPLVVLYARGYRFDWQSFRFTLTGTISVKTIPRGAAIFLNNKNYKKLSPTKIDGLKPKVYHLKITLARYCDWEADLVVRPELVTSATHIILFPENIPENTILADQIENMKVSSDDQKIIYNVKDGERKGTWLFLRENSEKIKLSDIYFNEFHWSPDNKKVLLVKKEAQGTRYGFLNLSPLEEGEKIKILDLGTFFKKPIENIAWPPSNSQKLFLTCAKNLYEMDPEKPEANLLQKNVLAFSPTSRGILFIQKNKNGYFLVSQEYRPGSLPKIVSPLPESEDYKIISDSKKIAVIAAGNLYLIQDILPRKIASNVALASWSPDGKRLLYFNEHQIGIYYEKDESNVILTRDSRRLQNIGWWPRSQYVLFTVEGKIKLIDAAREMNTHFITDIKNKVFFDTPICWSEDTKKLLYLKEANGNAKEIVEISLIQE